MEMIVKMNGSETEIADRKAGGRQKMLYLANTCRRFMDPYVPAMNLVLAQNVRVTADEKSGYVRYNSPYAHYQYEGEIYGPNHPIKKDGEIAGFWSPPHKLPTGRKMEHSTFRHPLATSHWDKAMMAARKEDIARSYEAYLRRQQS